MLQVKVLGKEIDLFEDTEIEYVIANPIFTPDEVLVPYSHEYEIPATANNLAIFGNPNLITSKVIEPRLSTISYKGVNIMTGVHKVVEVAKDKISIKFEIADRPYNLSKPLHKQYLGSMNVANLGQCGYQEAITKYSTIYTNKAAEKYPDVVCAPITLGNKDWIKEKQNDPDIYKTQRSSWINSFTGGSYTLPRRADTALPPMIPAVRIGYIIDQLFGGTLQNNIFNIGSMASLVLVCQWHPAYQMNNAEPIWDISGNNIDSAFASFMPNVTAVDFLVDVLKMVGASIFYVNNKLVMGSRQNMFTATGYEDWSGRLLDGYTISTRPAGKYSYGYGSKADKTAEAPGAYAKVRTVRDMLMDAVNIGGNPKIYEIESLGLTFECTQDVGKASRAKFELFSQNMGEPEEDSESENDSEGDFDVKLSASPVFMNLARSIPSDLVDPAQNSPDNKLFTFSPKIESSSKDERPKDLTIGCYAGMTRCVSQLGGERYYPMITYTNVSPHGDALTGIVNLRWDGGDGLINVFHKGFKKWVESEHKIINGQIKLEHSEIAALDPRKRYYIDGLYFFIEEISLRLNSVTGAIADITLVSVD